MDLPLKNCRIKIRATKFMKKKKMFYTCYVIGLKRMHSFFPAVNSNVLQEILSLT